MSQPTETSPPKPTAVGVLANALRGGLIGLVETIPGVSGGTMALVVGIYDRLIGSASHATTAVRYLITGRWQDCKAELAKVDWWLLIPVAVGMLVAVFTVAGPMAHAVETYPEQVRAIFFGMVLASVAVPIRLAGDGVSAKIWLLGVAAAVASFAVLSLPVTDLSPNPVTIMASAAIAVAALVLPGLSGSFLLLTLGLYQPTLTAVAERDFGYLAMFAAGALVGLIVIVKILRWFLTHHHKATMIVLAGVMVGALRSLWPWQEGERTLLAPADNWPLLLGLTLAGAAAVTALVVADALIIKRRESQVVAN